MTWWTWQNATCQKKKERKLWAGAFSSHHVCTFSSHSVCNHNMVLERQTVGTDGYLCEGAEFWVECTAGKRPFDAFNRHNIVCFRFIMFILLHPSSPPPPSPLLHHSPPISTHFYACLFFSWQWKAMFSGVFSKYSSAFCVLCILYGPQSIHTYTVTHTHTHTQSHTHAHMHAHTHTHTHAHTHTFSLTHSPLSLPFSHPHPPYPLSVLLLVLLTAF